MELDPKLTALCHELLRDDLGSDRFNMLLLHSGIKLDTAEWDVTNKILGKGDEIKHSLGPTRSTRQ